MKYLINADCYLVDEYGNVFNLTAPTFDVNFDTQTDASIIKTEIKKKLVRFLDRYVVIKESMTPDEKESVGIVNNKLLYYELYVGKTGKEVIKERNKK